MEVMLSVMMIKLKNSDQFRSFVHTAVKPLNTCLSFQDHFYTYLSLQNGGPYRFFHQSRSVSATDYNF